MEVLSFRDNSVESARRASSIAGRKKSEEIKPEVLTLEPRVLLVETDPYNILPFQHSVLLISQQS